MRWRDILGAALGAAFVCAAIAVIHYDSAIKPGLASLLSQRAIRR